MDSDDELGTMSPSSGKQSKARAPKAKKTKRGKSSKKKSAKKKVPNLESLPALPSVEDQDLGEPAGDKAEPFYVIGGVGGSRSEAGETDLDESQTTPQFSPSSSPEPSSVRTGQYYLVFVNTPAQSLIKSKVQLDFETFPKIAIGREAENVVVIPDSEVSRAHAELSMDGNRITLKDLQSTNGTYIFDGKEFQQVTGAVDVKPNSMIKFGNNTIVKLTCE